MLTKPKEILALGLFDIGAIKFGQFRLKLHEKNPDAPLSPIYVDLRILRSYPQAMDGAIDAYKELIANLSYDIYADVPTAATPIVAVLSHQTRIPFVSPRTDAKAHGTKLPIDGCFHEGQVVLLIDDLITQADSKLEAINVLENNGLIVHDVVVLVDREQGGVQQLKNLGYSCHVAFTITDLLQFYLGFGKINQQQYDETISYMAETAKQ